MITDFKIKNFRVFGNRETFVDIAPITILTGCNNSGKSSITKALCLMSDFCRQIRDDLDLGKKLNFSNYKWDFQRKPFNLMGSFNNVINKNILVSDNEENIITIEFTTFSNILLQHVKVNLNFYAKEYDDLNNGYLKSYTISTLDGNKIYEGNQSKKCFYNFKICKENILYFLNTFFYILDYQNNVAYGIQEGYDDFEYQGMWDHCLPVLEKMSKDKDFSLLIHTLEFACSQGSVLSKLKFETSRHSSRYKVFCYYPVFDLLDEIPKDKFREELDKLLQNATIIQLEKLSEEEKWNIGRFIDLFLSSDCKTVSDFMSREEDSLLIEFDAHTDESLGMPTIVWDMPVCGGHMGEDYFNIFNLCLVFGTLNKLLTDSKESFNYYDHTNDCYYYKHLYSIDSIMQKTIECIVSEIIPGNVRYAGTGIADVKRLYSLEENSEFVNTLKDYFQQKKELLQLKSSLRPYLINSTTLIKLESTYSPLSFINKWINEFGIAHHVEIKNHAQGFGVSIHLCQTEDDKDGINLADKGYGAIQIFAILLKIENAIIENSINNNIHCLNLTGVSHLSEYISSYAALHPVTVALEEPENHMHPSMQSLLATMVVEAYREYNVQFLIETHSEYFIRKMQTLFAEGKLEDHNIRILYVNDPRKMSEYDEQVVRIGINEDGSLDRAFGKGFFDEADSLVSDLFNINLRNNVKA